MTKKLLILGILGFGFSGVTGQKIHSPAGIIQSLDKGMIDAYIFYEIVLPEHPFVAYQLPVEFIDEITNYVIEIRGKQK